ALIVVGAFYAAYALALRFADFTQDQLFYATRPTATKTAGPFINYNHFATYLGMAALCASVKIFDLGSRTIIVGRGARQFALSAIHFLCGIGAPPLAAFALCFGMLVASGSRAGFMAFLFAIGILSALAVFVAGRRLTRGWAIAGFAGVV